MKLDVSGRTAETLARCMKAISRVLTERSSRIGANSNALAKLRLLITVASFFFVPFAAAQNWTLIWSDEFNGAAGSAPDSSNWKFETGNNNGWGNGELEYYCPPGNNTPPCSASNPNILLDGNGNLVIQAVKTQSGTWTSGRMKTEGLREFQYGRIEAKMKLPVGAGLWPAFWMLGSNIGTVNWPTCGEQDIMEWVPQYTPTTTSSTIHGPGYSGGNGIGKKFIFPAGGRVDDAGFHTYGVIWSQDKMQFYRDDYTQPFFTVTSADIPAGKQWVYNHPFFILLNLAVGGGFPGPPDGSTPSPALALVDYVRVYQQSPAITVTSSNNPSVFGQTVTFTATLSPASATGTVQFQDGATNLGAPVTVNNGTAIIAASSLSVGVHSITAVYSGDTIFAGSTGSLPTQTVNQALTSASVSSSANPSSFGQTVTFTATVSAVPPGSGAPAGTVQFQDGGNNLGPAATLSGGTAMSSPTSSLTVGGHSITAIYSGNTNFMGSTSSLFTQTVNQDSSSAGVSSSANPSSFGQPVAFTVVVSAVPPSSGTPTGMVQFKDGVNSLGLPVTLSNGTATLSPISSLTADAHRITAVYDGDAIFAGSTSPALTQSVTSTGTTATSTTISNIVVLPNPTPGQKSGTVHLEQSITVTATVKTSAIGTPTGSVALLDNNGAQIASSKDLPGTGSTQNVTFEPFEFGLGAHSIVAKYFGDSIFQTSESAASLINHIPRPR
jgi:beta-glucanase (GH16 family)